MVRNSNANTTTIAPQSWIAETKYCDGSLPMNLTTAWLKSYVRYPWDVRRAKSYLENGKTGDKSDESLLSVDTFHRPIVVELHTPQLLFDCGRHLNCVAMHARLAGSPFYLRCSKVLLAGIARKLYGRELLSMLDLSLIHI